MGIKRTLALVMAVMLLLPLAATLAETPPPRFFAKPEEAVIFFADSIAQGDIQAALSAMDARAAAEHGDYRALAERIRLISMVTSLLLPGEYAEYVTLNESRIRAQQAMQIFGFITSLLLPEWQDPGIPLVLQEGLVQLPSGSSMEMDEFITRLNPQNLSALSLRQVLKLDSILYNSETSQENIRKQAAIFGFHQEANLLAIYDLDGLRYSHSYTAVERDGGWQLSALNAPLLNTSAYGNAEAITAEEEARLINSPDYLLLFSAENQ